MDSTLFTVICSFLTGVLTLAVTKGVDGWLKLRADQRVDDIRKEAQEEGTLRFIIGRQDAQIEQLVKELNEIRAQHADCEKHHEALRVRLSLIEQQLGERRDEGKQ